MLSTRGYVQIFTGDGKGKTSAALGLAIRAMGRGLKVYITQFLKPPESSGEHFAASHFESQMTLKPSGRKGFIVKKGGEEIDRRMAAEALAEARAAMESGEYAVVILDEVNLAVYFELIPVTALLEFIEAKPAQVELIITGRKAHPDVIARADLVSVIDPIKHYYKEGVRARHGIEY